MAMGWFNESKRHSMASRGIKSAQKIPDYTFGQLKGKKLERLNELNDKLGKLNPSEYKEWKDLRQIHLGLKPLDYSAKGVLDFGKYERWSTDTISPKEQIEREGYFTGMTFNKNDGSELLVLGKSSGLKTRLRDEYVIIIDDVKQRMKPHGVVTEFIRKEEKGFASLNDAIRYADNYMGGSE